MNSPSLSQIGHWEQVQKAIRDISGFGALSEFLQSQSSQVLIIVFIVFLSPRWWLSMPSSSSSPPSSTSSSPSTSTSMSLSTLFEFDFVPTWIPTRFQLTFETTVRTSDNVNPILWSCYIILQSSPQPKYWTKSLYLDGWIWLLVEMVEGDERH